MERALYDYLDVWEEKAVSSVILARFWSKIETSVRKDLPRHTENT